MQQMQWSTHQIKQCNKETGQAMLSDEHSLVFYSQDFSKLFQSRPSTVCIPHSIDKIQAILSFANQNNLSLTIRGKGLSQNGQSLSAEGGFILHLEQLTKVLDKESEAIWVETSCTFAQLLELTLKSDEIPYVLPYNLNLSIGGVLSAGGAGASSFKFGPVSAHVKALEVILANGEKRFVDEHSDLFKACLSGQGRFAVITKACFKLRRAQKFVRTFYLVYLDKEQWLSSLDEIKKNADYIEAFCSPATQGLKLVSGKRRPFAQWLYGIHASVEYDSCPPEFNDLFKNAQPWQIVHQQDEPILTYLHRHDSRFEFMKVTGQWDLVHPWYECFMSKQLLSSNLEEILAELPVHYASLIQVVPIANKQQTGFFMLPEVQEVYELMILNPGVQSVLVPSCLQAMEVMDAKFLKQGGKRYLSGYVGRNLDTRFWQNHFGNLYDDWINLKEKYDKQHTFCSLMLLK
ncbi:MAG: FAD-binding oxidoreductase [Tatlockia sp.]|nr:FAD-binding oxidoreductase [Tatlockia sp.]